MAAVTGGVVEQRIELQDAYLEAWNSHDPPAVAAFFTPDAVYADHGAGQTAAGYEEILRHVESVLAAFPDLRFEFLKSTHGPDFTCGEWRADDDPPRRPLRAGPDRPPPRVQGVDIANLNEDGLVTRLTSYYDGAALMRQLGLLPDRGSRTERILLRVASLLPRRP